MPLTQPVSRVLTDEELVKRLRWPLGLSARDIRARLADATRYIDFDGTITDERTDQIRDTFCGKPLGEFLAETPYVLQTYGASGSRGAAVFAERRATTHPLLVISPPPISVPKRDLWFDPAKVDPEFDGSHWIWKDLAALGIMRGTVYDDWIGHMWAPGCEIVTSF